MYRRYSIVYVKDCQDRVLMGRRRDSDKFTNPGGGANKNECSAECAAREFKEETGVNLESLNLIKVFLTDEKNLIYMYEGFLPEEYEFDTTEDPDQEVETWEWVDPFDIIDELHIPVEKNVIVQYWAKG